MLYTKDEFIVSAGAVVFDAKQTQVLVIVDADNDSVSFPKGRLDKGESTDHAARREVEEETGVVCKLWPDGLMGVETRYSDYIKRTKIIYWYAATAVETRSQMLEDHERLTVKWLDINSAPLTLSFDDDRKLLQACLKAAKQ